MHCAGGRRRSRRCRRQQGRRRRQPATQQAQSLGHQRNCVDAPLPAAALQLSVDVLNRLLAPKAEVDIRPATAAPGQSGRPSDKCCWSSITTCCAGSAGACALSQCVQHDWTCREPVHPPDGVQLAVWKRLPLLVRAEQLTQHGCGTRNTQWVAKLARQGIDLDSPPSQTCTALAWQQPAEHVQCRQATVTVLPPGSLAAAPRLTMDWWTCRGR